MRTASLASVVVVVVGTVIALNIARGALVVGPTNILTLHIALALCALTLASRCSVTSIKAVHPIVAYVKHSTIWSNNLTTKRVYGLTA